VGAWGGDCRARMDPGRKGTDMERKERTKYRIAIVGLLAIIVSMMAGFAISAAVVDAGNGATNACYNTKNGKLRAAVTACKAGKETVRVLGGPNQVPASYAASSGTETELADVDLTVLSSGAVPAGTYLVNANLVVNNSAGVAKLVSCRLKTSTGQFGPQGFLQIEPNQFWATTLPMTARLTLTATGTVRVDCATDNSPSSVFVNFASNPSSMNLVKVQPL
jgi:hypothetical protein